MQTAKIVLSFTEGRVVRDLFYNSLPDMLINKGYSINCFTPAARVPSFIQEWERPGLQFMPFDSYSMDTKVAFALEIRKRIINRIPRFLMPWLKFEKHWFIRPDANMVNILAQERPVLVVITNPMQHYELSLFRAAQELGIPTLGVVRSWDNLFKGLCQRPDILAVWNPVNREEAIRLMKYPPEKVEMIGSTQFDAYFDPAGIWSRCQLAQKFNLDPDRPIITIATLGPFKLQYDETYLMDWLLAAIKNGELPSNAQVICRLHPCSRLEQFQKYTSLPHVRLSYIEGYIPSLAWTMTRQDVILVGNLLRHSDVVISPGSTITIETAIFDTPTIVPIFHTYQPDLGRSQFNQHLSTHFRRLKDLDLVPIVESPVDLAPAIRHALADRSWYRIQRAQLVKDYVHFTDGESTQRFANLISRMATHNH